MMFNQKREWDDAKLNNLINNYFFYNFRISYKYIYVFILWI